MKWTNSIKNKLVASIVLLTLCLLVLLSNYLDRLHTGNVKNSISTMYEDRLVAEHHILKMTQNIYEIKELWSAGNANHRNQPAITTLTTNFKTTFNIYSKTRLTKTEKATAIELITNFKKLEKSIASNSGLIPDHAHGTLSALNKLSTIQLNESKLIMNQVESQYAKIKASSQLAFAIIIVILIVLQVLVFSGESLTPLFKPQDPRLN